MPTFSYTSGNPNNLTAGGSASLGDIQGPFTDLRTFVNGGIGTSNLSSTAGITESQLASAGNGLAKGVFRAYRAAALSLATLSVVVFDTEPVDLSGWYNPANGRYTPQVAGYYQLSWMLTAGAGIATDLNWLSLLQKNGAADAYGVPGVQRGVTAGAGSGGSVVVQANGSTDYFDVLINQNAGAPAAFQVGAALTWFCGQLIGRA